MERTDGRPSEAEAPILQPFYLTFGVKYRPEPNAEQEQHPHWPYADGQGWVTIMATDYLAARRQATIYFDDKFSTVYPEDYFQPDVQERYFKRGQLALITEGVIDTATPDAPLPRWTIDKPQFHGHQPDDVVAVYRSGQLLDHPYDGSHTSMYFHPGDCAERGIKMFRVIVAKYDVEADRFLWPSRHSCGQCNTPIL